MIQTVPIGVAIPCYKYHIPALTRCLDSIEVQTVHPVQVVVSCSSSEQDDIPVYNYSFSLKVLVWEEKKNASQNRNIAATELLQNPSVEILSFFDADDEMHPQRIQFVSSSFSKLTAIVLHSYLDGADLEKEFRLFLYCTRSYNVLKRAASGCAVVEHDSKAKIHHSQVSIHRTIWNKVWFKEEEEYERREDAVFCGDVLSIPGIQSVYIDTPLSKYYMEGSWYS